MVAWVNSVGICSLYFVLLIFVLLISVCIVSLLWAFCGFSVFVRLAWCCVLCVGSVHCFVFACCLLVVCWWAIVLWCWLCWLSGLRGLLACLKCVFDFDGCCGFDSVDGVACGCLLLRRVVW